ncbi:DUF2141 domain-containing protein [Sphingomonas profundi]|uniref:DUF2141 domain-containing protein n=1 Tax=Alterirhizorhabdus profundi TaxID=2681549 RepID=UPI0012E781F4|nr:DUF2141 domain-containing protein [Sphingomonas profundi]
MRRSQQPAWKRHRAGACRIALAPLALCLLSAAAPWEGTLVIHVGNVRSAAGRVHADLCPERTFLKDGCGRSVEAPAVPGTTIVTIAGVPPGRYAVQLSHDENGNGRVDRGLFGIPKEGVGFSNDAPIRFGPPKFADAAIDVRPGSQTIDVRMRYFSGPSGPPAPR